MDQTTHNRLIPCEKHAAIIGRQAVRLAQQSDTGLLLRQELLYLVESLRKGDLGQCSHDFCVSGDDSESESRTPAAEALLEAIDRRRAELDAGTASLREATAELRSVEEQP